MSGGELVVAGAESALWFELPQLRSKSNFRRGARSRNWNGLQSFEGDLALTARAVRPMDWPMGDSSKPVAARPGVVAVVFAETLLDTGNATKSVFDALEGVLYHTDASIRAELVITTRQRQGRCVAGFAVCGDLDLAGYAACVQDLARALSSAMES